MATLRDISSQVRRDILRMVHAVQSGHPGGSLGCADLLTALYFKIMKHDPAFHMEGKGEDLFVGLWSALGELYAMIATNLGLAWPHSVRKDSRTSSH